MYYHTAITQSLKPFILKPHNRKIPKNPMGQVQEDYTKKLNSLKKNTKPSTPQELYQKAFPRKITPQKASPSKMLTCHFPISFLVHVFDLTTGYV